MNQGELTATTFVTSRLVTFLIAVTGGFFLFRPSWLGWDALVESAGSETRLLGLGLAVAFFLLAALSHEKNQLRVRMAETLVALNQLLYGRNYRNEREAIETLIKALEAGGEGGAIAHKHLMRLTGQNFAADGAVWRSWWSAHARHFELRRSGATEGEPDPSDSPEPPRV